jgi:hypothetical protein
MHVLAGRLYAFAQAGNPRVEQLTMHVNKLLGFGNSVDYYGASADKFKASYGQDAAIMSGLNKIISAAAAVIDTLASRLATIEQRIEVFVSNGVQAGYFVQDERFRKTNYPSPGPDPIMYQKKVKEFDQLFQRCSADAQRARELAAAQLSKLADALLEGLDYYKSETGMAGTLDPHGLLRKGQIEWYSPRIEELRKMLDGNKSDLDRTNLDRRSVLQDMQAIGGAAQQVGDVISIIPVPPAQKVGEAVSTTGGVLSGLAGIGEYFAG